MKLDAEQLHPTWQSCIKAWQKSSSGKTLLSFLKQEYNKKTIFPTKENLLRALELCPVDKVKCVILGQDPYHGPGQAQGLSFSVPQDFSPLPPSLRNIFKELQSDLDCENPAGGDLTPWAEQGVLLLNSVLSVRQSEPASHAKKGWEELTAALLQLLNESQRPIAFILWGKHAHKLGENLDGDKHLLICSAHPSPLSARRGFFGSKPFSSVNDWLQQQGRTGIDWQLPAAEPEEGFLPFG